VKGRLRTLLLWSGSLCLTGFLLWLFLRGADLRRVAEEAKSADPGWLLAALGFELLSVLLRTHRWGVLLRPSAGRRVRFGSLLKATVVSFSITGLVPGRVGEVAKPFLLARWEGLPFAAVTGTAVLDRGLDLFALILLWLAFVLFGGGGVAPDAAETLVAFDHLSYVALALFVPLGLFLWWLAPRRRILGRWVKRHPRLQAYPLVLRILAILFQFASGLDSFRRKRTILYLSVLSLATWLAVAAAIAAIFRALHMDLPWGAAVVALMAISLGAAVPTPGGVGGVHKVLALALSAFYAMGPDETVAAGLVIHALLFFPAALWGLGYFLLGRVHLQEVRQAAREGRGLKPGPGVG
jgi:hypothetical protein